jgi:hypothetical protein
MPISPLSADPARPRATATRKVGEQRTRLAGDHEPVISFDEEESVAEDAIREGRGRFIEKHQVDGASDGGLQPSREAAEDAHITYRALVATKIAAVRDATARVRAVTHQYGILDWQRVHALASSDLGDLDTFCAILADRVRE